MEWHSGRGLNRDLRSQPRSCGVSTICSPIGTIGGDSKRKTLGMLSLTGVIAQLKAGEERWRKFTQPLFSFLVGRRYHSKSELFFDAAVGYRRRFASLRDTNVPDDCVLSLWRAYGRRQFAIDMARDCARKLIKLQGPQGEWPWFFDAAQGQVLDFYEVYSVHQYGMAPAFALIACGTQRSSFREGGFGSKGFQVGIGQYSICSDRC